MRSFDQALSEVGIAEMDKTVVMPIVVTVNVAVRFSAEDGRVTGFRNPSFEEVAAAAAKRGGITRIANPTLKDVEKEAKLSKLL